MVEQDRPFGDPLLLYRASEHLRDAQGKAEVVDSVPKLILSFSPPGNPGKRVSGREPGLLFFKARFHQQALTYTVLLRRCAGKEVMPNKDCNVMEGIASDLFCSPVFRFAVNGRRKRKND
jgi:hypothetical protein